MKFQPTRRIGGKGPAPHQFARALRGVGLDDQGRLHAVGDSAVKVFDAEGGLVRQWATGLPGECVAVDESGKVWVGQEEQVEIYSPEGELRDTWRDPGTLGLVTAIGFGRGGDVVLADASARWVRRYDREGTLLNNIGDQHRKGGFHIPNGVVDFAVDADGNLRVANPGMHRVERYAPDGALLGRFGRFDGQDPAGFPGCCNPIDLVLLPESRVAVAEKAPSRVKVYDLEGQLLAYLGPEHFGSEGRALLLAADTRGRLHVADSTTVHVYE